MARYGLAPFGLQAALLLLTVAACSESTTPSPPPTFTMTPAAQWSGGEVRVTSAAFAGGGLPVLLAGAETLSVNRISDSVVGALVPLGPSGAVSIELAAGQRRYPVGDVQRVGFKSSTSISPGFYGEMLTARDGNEPVVVGAVPGTGMVQTLRPSTMGVTVYPGIFAAEYYGVSPTNKSNEFVVVDSLFHPYVWRLWPSPALVDSPPAMFGPPIRHLAKLSDSVWLKTSHHYSNTYVNTTAVYPGFGLQVESPWVIHLSPDGQIATHSVSVGWPGVQVYSALTGDTLYTLGELYNHAQAAAFSGDGARIYYLGGRQTDSDSLLAVRATTGEVLAGHRITEGEGFNLATDPTRPVVYAEILVGGWPTVLVYDEDLKLIGRLPAPASAAFPPCSMTCFEGAIAVDRVHNELHVVWSNNPAGVFTFDLLP